MLIHKKQIFCNNCGKIGHLFHQCKLPITSIGVICFRIVNNNLELLLIRRKDSLSFLDFMRGKYNLENYDYIKKLFNRMTKNELALILNNDFDYLWKNLWGNNINNVYKNEEKLSKIKFNKLKNGYLICNNNINMKKLIEESNSIYDFPEWGFPKGRRNYQEKDLNCGIREFDEETGYKKKNLIIINNLNTFEEVFIGSNYKSYKHKYFLSYIHENIPPEGIFQTHEISKIEWVNIDDCNSYIRDYNVEKIEIINSIKNLLKTYKLYV
jgi:ADP-ribose pyrophosphatase YjhB (NUDIX family)